MFSSQKLNFSDRKLQHLKVFGQLCEEAKISPSYRNFFLPFQTILKTVFLLFYLETSLLNMGNLFLHFYYHQEGKKKER